MNLHLLPIFEQINLVKNILLALFILFVSLVLAFLLPFKPILCPSVSTIDFIALILLSFLSLPSRGHTPYKYFYRIEE